MYGKKEAFITLKDHKGDFNVNPKCRLINAAKSELGKVSKTIVGNINMKVKKESFVKQWENTNDVISWFCNIKDKANCIFIPFDIEEFYPSISKKLVLKVIKHAKQLTTTERYQYVRKSLLFANVKYLYIYIFMYIYIYIRRERKIRIKILYYIHI